MDNKNEKEIVKVAPYDDSMWDQSSMYDKMPYTWDPDLNVDKTFPKSSGNIIKAYRCQTKEPYEVKHEG